MFRPTYARISEETLRKNAEEIISKYPSYRTYFGVVKGSAYGHGSYCVKKLVEGGINYLATSSVEEALDVRKYETETPVLVMEPTAAKLAPVFTENNFAMTVSSVEEAQALSELILPSPLKIHLKLDCGMNRLGLKEKEEVNLAFSLIKKNPSLLLEGIFTHLPTGGIWDAHYDAAIDAFLSLTEDIDLSEIPIVHLDRSLTLVHHEKLPFETGVRLGIVLYGFSQSLPEPKGIGKIKRKFFLKKTGVSPAVFSNDLNVKPAFSLYSRVIALRQVKKGEAVGYGATFLAPEDGFVATLPIGYFDGVEKSLGEVCIRGKHFPIVGEVCMDMITLWVDESVKVGDEAELFGESISIRKACRKSGINAYRLLTKISTRVPRVYDDETEIKY